MTDYLWDLDGTLADCEHRRHFLARKPYAGAVGTFTAYRGESYGIYPSDGDKMLLVEPDERYPLHWWCQFVKHPDQDLVSIYAARDLKIKKDWSAFYNAMGSDTVNWPVVDILGALRTDTENSFWLFTGRPDNYRDATEHWLQKHGLTHCFERRWDNEPGFMITMRKAGDNRPDMEVKREMFETLPPWFKPTVAFDDRTSCVRLWRKLGLTCFQVAEGDF